MAWTDKILRVDLSNRKSWIEDTEPYKRQFIGGKGINVKIMYDEVGPEVGPFDPENLICLGPGALAGTLAPTHSRMKITSVSPNGFMNNSGLGGHLPAEIKLAGYDNVVIQGRASSPIYLFIKDDKVDFREAGHLLGLDTQETQRAIKSELSDQVKVACIGPAGEKRVNSACIVAGPGSAAGRNGFGAIMGAKNLKAIAVRGTGQPTYQKQEEFSQACLETYHWLPDSCGVTELQHKGGHGDKYSLDFFHDVWLLPLGNWVDYGTIADAGTDPGAEAFYHEHAAKQQYGCRGCPVHHFHLFDLPGRAAGPTKCTQWESFSTMVWNKNRRLNVQANILCQLYGLDSTATCNAVAFLMDLYYQDIITEKDTDDVPMKRGDERAILTAIEKIGKQEGFGKLFNDGVLGAAREIGGDAEYCAMVVNAQELEPFEYRAFKSWALAAATTDGSISHSIAYLDMNWVLSREEAEKEAVKTYGSKKAAVPTEYDYKALIVHNQEIKTTAGDLIGACKWIWPWGIASLEVPAKLFSLACDLEMSEEDLKSAARRVLTLERAWRARKGLRRDDMPGRLFEAPIPDGIFKGETLHRDGFDKMLGEYYQLHGWDEDGAPKEETFVEFDLAPELERFKAEMSKQSGEDV